jgi:hypothetical protein
VYQGNAVVLAYLLVRLLVRLLEQGDFPVVHLE